MSWLIVVGALVVVALAVHAYEQRRARRVIAARRAQRLQADAGLRWFESSRQVREDWRADLEDMTLEITCRESLLGDDRLAFRLSRSPEGVWRMAASDGESASVERPLPGVMAAPLEAQYRRLRSKVAKQLPGK